MKFAFRADASIRIGSGHVMRCLTLARELRGRGHDCLFLTGEQPGGAANMLHEAGFRTEVICSQAHETPGEPIVRSPYADWLGGDWRSDASQCRALLGEWRPDWLIVDHYALDRDWEAAMAASCHRLMVIDDLADRTHDCDVLLDQNLGRRPADYDRLLPVRTKRLIGPRYALLRPEFHRLRAQCLARRHDAAVRSILVFMGGIDKDNATGQVLEALSRTPSAAGAGITVVLGRDAPWLDKIRRQASEIELDIDVRADVGDMALVMSAADLAIGAAGGAAWERCCLGLPSIIVVLADNQRQGASALAQAGAAIMLDGADEIGERLPAAIMRMDRPGELALFAERAASVTDGLGAGRVADHLCSAFGVGNGA